MIIWDVQLVKVPVSYTSLPPCIHLKSTNTAIIFLINQENTIRFFRIIYVTIMTLWCLIIWFIILTMHRWLIPNPWNNRMLIILISLSFIIHIFYPISIWRIHVGIIIIYFIIRIIIMLNNWITEILIFTKWLLMWILWSHTLFIFKYIIISIYYIFFLSFL
jgi:hypothetical protein